MNDRSRTAFQLRNVRMFILFRVLFNARFYYPVFSILFLDFGLSLSQFAILNAVWAATIVCCEVPSGALADSIGRKNLLVCAGGLMVAEIALWAFVPRSNPNLLFWVFVVNRVFSGMAEAAASGADEALAYDSLQQAGLDGQWGHVLERQMQMQSAGFVVVMTLGGAIYDPSLMQRISDFLGLSLAFSRESTLRLPIYLTLLTALLTLATTLRMQEISPPGERDGARGKAAVKTSFQLVWSAGRWIFRTPYVLGIMLFGLLYDSVIRMLLTMASQYYRQIAVPEALFGILGSALALFGFVVPSLARRLTEQRSPLFNLVLNGGLILLGLAGMALVLPYWGILPALLLFGSLYLIGFFLSHYLNQATDSGQRATVLSFKGLFLNIGYGGIGLLYSLLLALLRGKLSATGVFVSEESLKSAVFVASLPWFSWYFLGCLALLLFAFSRVLRSR